MPIIKSAQKRVKQTAVRKARNFNVRTALRKSIRKISDLVKAKDLAGAQAELGKVYSTIDTACKKKVLHKNTASRRKATIAKMVASIQA